MGRDAVQSLQNGASEQSFQNVYSLLIEGEWLMSYFGVAKGSLG